MIVACWRVLYGEDWIVPSLLSVLPHVDGAVIFWSDRPWGEARSVHYLGAETPIPWKEGKPFDGWVDRIREQNLDPRPPVEQFYFHAERPQGYWTRAINEKWPDPGQRPETLVLLECDHVWRDDQFRMAIKDFRNNRLRCAKSRQVELWKSFGWRIPERPNRTGCVFWNTRNMSVFPDTRHQGEPKGADFETLRAEVHNLGFCSSERTMLSKHLCALSFSGRIGDSRPNARWLEDVWKRWVPGMENLEISEGHESNIPFAIPYDRTQIPEVLR